VIGVDIGGTKLAAGVVDGTGAVRHAERVATPTGGDAESVWDALAALIDRVRGREAGTSGSAAGGGGPSGIGVGCGGPMRRVDGVVSPLNIRAWRDFPLRERLAGLVAGAPVRLHNDAVAFAVGEHWRGAGAGLRNVLGMVVSTGVGGGLVLADRVVDGATGNAGHIGHVVVDPGGPPCACGGRGCLEAIASGPNTLAWAGSKGWTGVVTDGESLVRDAAAGHPIALAALRRAGEALGVGIASALALCDVELVVIGGGLAAAGDLLLGPLAQALRRHARLDFVRDVRVVGSGLGPHAGLVGAAALILHEDRYWCSPAPVAPGV
jgi:glucokinase